MVDEGRTTIQTYLPATQKEVWREHADELDMSLSEFVRTMVQAGRRGFTLDSDEEDVDAASESTNPGGEALETHLLDVLSNGGHYTWEELVDELSNDIEDRLDETLDRLQYENRVRYNGRHGGYTLVNNE